MIAGTEADRADATAWLDGGAVLGRIRQGCVAAPACGRWVVLAVIPWSGIVRTCWVIHDEVDSKPSRGRATGPDGCCVQRLLRDVGSRTDRALAHAQPRWIGADYWHTRPRVAFLLLHPGSDESRNDRMDVRFNRLLEEYAAGTRPLEDVLAHEREDMPNWGRGRFLQFYSSHLGLRLDRIAFLEVAWCATKQRRAIRSRCWPSVSAGTRCPCCEFCSPAAAAVGLQDASVPCGDRCRAPCGTRGADAALRAPGGRGRGGGGNAAGEVDSAERGRVLTIPGTRTVI